MFGQLDGRRLAQVLLERCPDRDRHRVEVHITAGFFGLLSADRSEAKAAFADALRLSAELGERALEGWARFGHGLTEILGGEVDAGRHQLEAARAIHGEVGAGAGEARSTAALGLTFVMAGEAARARELVELALSIGSATGTGRASATPTSASWPNRAERMRRVRHRTTSTPSSACDRTGTPRCCRWRWSARLACSVAATRRCAPGDGGGVGHTCPRRGRLRPVLPSAGPTSPHAAEAAVGGQAERLWQQGGRLGVEEAIALAFGAPPWARRSPAGGMSPRERQVAQLVTDGLSNKEIAARLHLSVRTVESHVRHLLTRAGLSNRTQLARWALERLP